MLSLPRLGLFRGLRSLESVLLESILESAEGDLLCTLLSLEEVEPGAGGIGCGVVALTFLP